ncbi:MAG: aminodeoxychorismate lyase [Candidatus Saccharibacteria bacterium]|nr:aminodeoxychorismate lyase [Moraxellaceae bacterium]
MTEFNITTFKNGVASTAINPFDRAFLYGDGLFTSVRIYEGQPCLWSHHLYRLQQGAQRLSLDVDFKQLELDALQKAALLVNGVLKIIISRGDSERGYLPPKQPAVVYIQLFQAESKANDLVMSPIESGVLLGQLGQVMPQLAGLKTLNRLEQVILRQELATYGWAEGLVCDVNGLVVEGVYSNCFFLVGGQWWTPPIYCSGILGVMRTEIIERMQAQDNPPLFQTLHLNDLGRIEALFFCNALTQIVPVRQLNGRILNVSAVTTLANLLF